MKYDSINIMMAFIHSFFFLVSARKINNTHTVLEIIFGDAAQS